MKEKNCDDCIEILEGGSCLGCIDKRKFSPLKTFDKDNIDYYRPFRSKLDEGLELYILSKDDKGVIASLKSLGCGNIIGVVNMSYEQLNEGFKTNRI